MLTDLALPKAALLFPPLVVAESTYQGVRSSVLGEFLVNGAAALVFLLLLWTAVEKLRGGPKQKREVSFADEYATRKEHTELKAEVLKIDNERRASTAKLHEKIDEIATDTSKTSGQLTQINQQLQQINTHLLNK